MCRTQRPSRWLSCSYLPPSGCGPLETLPVENDSRSRRRAVQCGGDDRAHPSVSGWVKGKDPAALVAASVEGAGQDDGDVRPSGCGGGAAQIRLLQTVGIGALNDDTVGGIPEG